MRKIIVILALLLAICCFTTMLTACHDVSHEQIVAEYTDLHNISNGVTLTCYGEFHGAHVVYFEGLTGLPALSDLTVGGVTFHFGTTQQFDVYYRGKFYTLREAFNKGILSLINLLEVRKNHKANNEYLYSKDN